MEANLRVPREQELNCDLPRPHDRLKSVHETGNVFLTLINILADHDWGDERFSRKLQAAIPQAQQ